MQENKPEIAVGRGKTGHIRCAIFDFDGTLFDSMYVWDLAGQQYLRSQGCMPKPTLQEDLKTMSLYQAACYMQREYAISQPVEAIMDGINKAVERFYFDDVQPKPGIPAFLQTLRDAGVTLCIATATDRYQIEAALQRCGLDHFFPAIFTCTEVGHGKDNPLIYRLAMAHCGADRDTTVIFEDAIHAVETAKADGFTVIGIRDESEPRQPLLQSLADCYLTDFTRLDRFWAFVGENALPKPEFPLRTARLTIRPIVETDWTGVQRIWEDMHASPYAQYDIPHNPDPTDVRNRIARWARANQGTDHLFFAICLGEAVIGYYSFHRRPDGYEIGYCFHSAYHKNGYARESLAALIPYMRQLGVSRLTAGTALENLPSVKLLTALGFQQIGTERVSFYKDSSGHDIEFDGGRYARTL